MGGGVVNSFGSWVSKHVLYINIINIYYYTTTLAVPIIIKYLRVKYMQGVGGYGRILKCG